MISKNYLSQISPGSTIDQVIMISPNISDTLCYLGEAIGTPQELIYAESSATVPEHYFDAKEAYFHQYRANVHLSDDLDLSIVQPVKGDSIYSLCLKENGGGIMGFRILVPENEWSLWSDHIEKNNITVIETVGDYEKALDLRNELGCFLQLVRKDKAEN